MPLEGDLAHFRLADILQVVSHQRKTGILTVQGRSDILAVSFLDGSIVAADALNQSFDELLGGVLSKRGLVDPSRFSRLVDEQRSSGERLFDFLVARQAVERQQLLEAIEDLTYRLILDVLSWREGQFKFYGGEEVAHEEGIRPLRVDDLLMRSIRDLPADEAKPAIQISGMACFVSTMSGRTVRQIPAGFDDSTPLDPAISWVTPDEDLLLHRLDGRMSAEALARASGFGESRTYFALSRLVVAGLARELGEGEEPPEVAAVAAAPARRPGADAVPVERERRPARKPEAARSGDVEIGRAAIRFVRAVPLGAAAILVVLSIASPGALLFPAPGQGDLREAFSRSGRLARFAAIDRAARTHHLVEGRYPSSIADLGDRGLLPARATRSLDGLAITYQARGEEYEISLGDSLEPSNGVREGVFGDFLLDRSLFAGLAEDSGVPIVLID